MFLTELSMENLCLINTTSSGPSQAAIEQASHPHQRKQIAQIEELRKSLLFSVIWHAHDFQGRNMMNWLVWPKKARHNTDADSWSKT